MNREKRKPLTNLSTAQRLWGVEKTTFYHPRFVPEGICEWCSNPIINKRRFICCSEECTQKYNIATSTVYYANSGSRGGYGNHILRRDKYTCQDCGELHAWANENGLYLPTTDGELDIHHSLSISMGGDDNPDNLVTLCRECHKQRHKKEATQC